MQSSFSISLPSESHSTEFAQLFAQALCGGLTIYLEGELGAGKTHLVRETLRALGHQGAVKSPTYTLMEQYDLAGYIINHLDLYRLADPEELEYLGYRDLPAANSLQLVEWPGKGEGFLNAADLEVFIAYKGDGRVMKIKSKSESGLKVLDKLIKLCEKLSH